jgi:hypothetical protein
MSFDFIAHTDNRKSIVESNSIICEIERLKLNVIDLLDLAIKSIDSEGSAQ